jgi:predicted transcriptional regulator
MIDFACKQFNLDDIIKCGLNLTKTEFKIMEYFLKNKNDECTTISISKKLNLNLTTIQKAVKKLFEKNIILRHQKNLDNGGYIYTYESNSKSNVRKIIKEIIKNWSNNVEKKIDKW